MKPTRVTREEILAMTPEELDELSAELQGWVKRSVSGVDTWCIDNAPYDLLRCVVCDGLRENDAW
jgi:hypothetical protein